MTRLIPPEFACVVSVRPVIGGIIALVTGGLAAFFEAWTIVPAPSLPTLAAAVIVPESTPWAIGCCIVVGLVCQVAASGWPRTLGLFGSAFAAGLALIPWCLLPSTINSCEAEMKLALGNTYASSLPAWQRARLASQPYSLGAAFGGHPMLRVIRMRQSVLIRLRDGTRLGLDVYAPATPGPRPTVILIYGGAWIFGSRNDSAQLARNLAGQGYTAIAIDYRHAPAYRFPTQLEDVRDAIVSIARNAAAWGVDPLRVAIFGRSAGAQLALLAAYAPEPMAIRAVIAYYAPIDLVRGYRFPPRPDPADVDRILRTYMGGSPDDRMPAYVEASPVTHVRPGLPATLLINGGRDELVRPAFEHEMRDALRLHGVRVAALELPWSNHAFDEVTNGTGAQLARYYSELFLAATL